MSKQKTTDEKIKSEPPKTGVQQAPEPKAEEKKSPNDVPQVADSAGSQAQPKMDEEKKSQYSFPTKSECPRCKATDTTAYATKGNVQYRRCRRAVCRWLYHVIGTKI
jgi:outer membrane biosynthesis protein TonB